ncbi:hypothetical protein BKA58DRAFT_436295 [Alternaria rosae]|uniref:uncharacterized protein n=1 Tax=Alternaria rosae TaxID=1187941 RepID=UPI001E8E81E9|nr:uncharacterized protein BKA58DRAFT_436295 [Alternaria rosae]KAH6878600.1 hypothetical protein BKA58DRAFT_436295 [Alternaria rosae]
MEFNVPEDSWAIHKRHIQSTSNLFALPPDVLETICEYALSLLESIVIVLGSKTSLFPVFPLLDLVKRRSKLLGVVAPSIYTSNTFTFLANVHKKRATYGDMSHAFFLLRTDVLGIRTTVTTTLETFRKVKEEAKRRPGKRLARPRFHYATHDMSNPTKAEERGKYYARWLKHLVPVGEKTWEGEMTDDGNRVPGSLIRVWDDLRIALLGEGLRAAW